MHLLFLTVPENPIPAAHLIRFFSPYPKCNIKSLYDEKYDKASFIKNIILDNILPSDIYIKSKELHFATDVDRVVYLIRFHGKSDMIPFDMVQNMYPDKNKDYVISVGEQDIVLVKEMKSYTDYEKQLDEAIEGILKSGVKIIWKMN